MNAHVTMSRRFRRVLMGAASVALALMPPLVAAVTPPGASSTPPLLHPDESRLLRVIDAARENRYDEALRGAEALVRANPRFKLAQLVYGDLLSARGGALPLSTTNVARAVAAQTLRDLRREERLRLDHFLNPAPPNRIPGSLLHLSQDQRRAVVVDIAAHRLYLFARTDAGPRLVADYYVSTGKKGANKRREGDQRTPVGVYFVTRRLDPRGLADLYGAGAFPINYPNEWDRRQGRTGFGIWIHGVPARTYNRAPEASDGCMAIPNADVRALWERLDVATTPVVITDQVKWTDPVEVRARRAVLSRAIESWRRDWESRDLDRYARHYATDFRGEDLDRRRWMAHKRRVNAGKRYIRVALGDVSLFAYPGEPGMVVATFTQNYDSGSYRDRTRKRQYWRRDADGEWRITYEGPARFTRENLRGIPYSARSLAAQR